MKGNQTIRRGNAFLLLLIFTLITPALQAEPTPLTCDHLYYIEQGYLQQHFSYNSFDPTLEKRTTDQILDKLDGSKLYLLKEDVTKIQQLTASIFSDVKKRDCKNLDQIYQVFLKRVEERVAFSKKVLDDKFKFDKETSLTLNAKKRDYFPNQKEADTFQKKYLQFQISNYLNTDMKLPEAKEHVLRSYDRLARRVKEWSKDRIYAIYLDAFAHSLDPHSTFFAADEWEDFQIQMSLSLEGIGATLGNEDGFTVVEHLVPGGAAERSGQLQPKDKIIAVAQGGEGKFENVIEMDLRDVVKKIRGKKGTAVKLRILRKANDKQDRFDVVLIRDQIKLEDEAASITYVDKVQDGATKKIGILNLPSFYADSKSGGRSSATDVKRLLAEARKNNVNSLVLDLSRNGGGSLDDAVKIAGLFFKTGAVVKQSHRDEAEGRVLSDSDRTVDYNGPMVVLISRVSASASEIVSGTLKDYGRALIVGADHTFGKGSIQSVTPLPTKSGNLGALKITVGMFFIPGGASTQHQGVSSDIVFPSLYATDDVGEKTLDYSLPPKKLASFISPDAYVKEGDDQWKIVPKEVVDAIRKKSEVRITESADFQKLKKEIATANKKKDDIIKVSDLIKEKDQKSAEEKKEEAAKTKEQKQALYLKRADVQEAINIAADLESALGNPSVNLVRTGAAVKEKN